MYLGCSVGTSFLEFCPQLVGKNGEKPPVVNTYPKEKKNAKFIFCLRKPPQSGKIPPKTNNPEKIHKIDGKFYRLRQSALI